MARATLDDVMAALAALEREMASLADLRAEIADLKTKVTALEGRVRAAETAEEEVSAETIIILAAAVTSYLGKRVRIRSARRVQTAVGGASPWAQQGRISVQGTHQLHRNR